MKSEKLHQDEVKKVSEHWLSRAREDRDTMKRLFENGLYPWSMFLGHLCLEKLIKSKFVETMETHAPRIHDLYRLADMIHLFPTPEQADMLDIITTFNLNTRYDDYKNDFRQLCTKDFAEMWLERIEYLWDWIENKP